MDSDGSRPPQDNDHPRSDRPVDSTQGIGPARQQPTPAPLLTPDQSPTPAPSTSDPLSVPDAAPTPTEVVVRPAAGTGQPAADDRPAHLFGYLAVYTLLRLVLVAVLTGVLMIFMPLIVALLFAIIVQLPLSWLLFAGPRRRVNEAMARSTAQRRMERDRLQAALSGEDPPD